MKIRCLIAFFFLVISTVPLVYADNLNITLVWQGAPRGASDVYVEGAYAYLACENGLVVFDVQNPKSPRETGRLETPVPIKELYVKDGFAYLACGKSGLRIIDVSNPKNLHEAGFTEKIDDARRVFVTGSKAFVVDGTNWFQIIDVADPVNPKTLGLFEKPA